MVIKMTKIWEIVQGYSSKILGEDRAKNFVALLKNSWNGKEPLKRVFWIYGVAVCFLLSLLFVAPMASTGGRLGESIALLIMLPYEIWIIKSTWSCAENIECEEFKGLPKIYLTLGAKFLAVFCGVNYFFALFG